MFSVRTAVQEAPAGHAPREVWISLNTPVVTIAQLPVGPAQAGLAVHAGPDGPRLTLALRSVRTGQVVLFAADEAWRGAREPSLARDAALSFAESMGFLFDEALADAREAVVAWSRLVAAGAQPAPEPPASLWPESPEPARGPLALSKFRFAAAATPAARSGVLARLLGRF